MSTDDYRRALEAALREYERAAADRAALDVRLAELHQTIGTLSRLCGLTPTVVFGLTDACRLVLRGAGAPMTAVQVRDRMQAIGFDFTRYSNALAAVHTVLKRLTEAGEASLADGDDTSRVAYEFLASGLVASRVPARPVSPKPSRRHSEGRR